VTCTQCQMVQMASPDNLGRMLQLANEQFDREFNRRVQVELEHAGCGERIAELEEDLQRANLTVVARNYEIARLRRKKAG
jgi:hypothetical protein